MSDNNIEIKILSCKLNSEELHEKSKDLAFQNEEKLRLKFEAGEINAKAKKAEQAVNKLSRIVDTGEELRAIECKWKFNYTGNEKGLVRQDTFETIETRSLMNEDRQQNLFPRVA